MRIDRWLLPIFALLVIGAALSVTSEQPVYKGGPKHVYPISELKEYASYGRGVYIETSPYSALYVFYKQAFGGIDPGTYRFTFIIEAQNFDTLPHAEIIASFDKINASIGATLETTYSINRVEYTFRKFEVPYSDTLMILSHIIEFEEDETRGVVTFYAEIYKYETQLTQLGAGIALVTCGVGLGLLRLRALIKTGRSSKTEEEKRL